MKILNILKWIGLAIIAFPWFSSASVGALLGSLFASFMNGFKRGALAINQVAVKMKQVELQEAFKKNESVSEK